MNCQPIDQTQAEAVYAAMLQLNIVGAYISVKLPNPGAPTEFVTLEQCPDTKRITVTGGLRTLAQYSNQGSFAEAFGLAQG